MSIFFTQRQVSEATEEIGDRKRWLIQPKRERKPHRIKLVAQAFEKILGRRLLKKNDRFLFLARYLWYADMLAFKHLGKGMTGASYAALPYGPQMNNYKDLVQLIKESDTTQTEPLSLQELDIIKHIAETFPEDEDVYRAAHRERTWQDAHIGSLLAYPSACELSEIHYTVILPHKLVTSTSQGIYFEYPHFSGRCLYFQSLCRQSGICLHSGQVV